MCQSNLIGDVIWTRCRGNCINSLTTDVQVEFTTIKKTTEKRSDLGLITIKLFKESRPFTVKVGAYHGGTAVQAVVMITTVLIGSMQF